MWRKSPTDNYHIRSGFERSTQRSPRWLALDGSDLYKSERWQRSIRTGEDDEHNLRKWFNPCSMPIVLGFHLFNTSLTFFRSKNCQRLAGTINYGYSTGYWLDSLTIWHYFVKIKFEFDIRDKQTWTINIFLHLAFNFRKPTRCISHILNSHSFLKSHTGNVGW